MITDNLNVIPDARVRNITSKGPKYRFPSNIGFPKCHREITASLNDFSNRCCKRENDEPDALKKWKINIFKIIDTGISFYSRNTLFYMNYSWLQAIKLLTMLYLFDDCIILILLNVSLLTPMPINCRLL